MSGFQLKTTAGKLKSLAGLVAGTVGRHSTIPILGNFLLQSLPQGRIALTGSDMEHEITAVADLGAFAGSLNTTVEARKLLDVVGALDGNDPLDIAYSDEKLVIKSPGGRFKFACLDALEYPRIVASETTLTVSLKQAVLKEVLERTAFAMANNDIRYYLNGMLLMVGNGVLRIAATNGHHLATDRIAVTGDAPENPVEVILQRKAVTELTKLLDTSDDADLTLRLGKSHASLIFGNVQFVTKLVEGRFPNIDRVIPEISEAATIDRSRLLRGMGLCSIVTNKTHGVLMRLASDMGGALLKLEATNDLGEIVQNDIAVADYAGKSAELGFNLQYWREALSAQSSETVDISFKMSSDLSGGQVLMTLPDNPDFRYVIMSMRM